MINQDRASIAERAYFLWLNGEPGSDNERWCLAADVQRYGDLYDKIFEAVRSEIQKISCRRVNRQTSITEPYFHGLLSYSVSTAFPGRIARDKTCKTVRELVNHILNEALIQSW